MRDREIEKNRTFPSSLILLGLCVATIPSPGEAITVEMEPERLRVGPRIGRRVGGMCYFLVARMR